MTAGSLAPPPARTDPADRFTRPAGALGYDGTSPFPVDDARELSAGGRVQIAVTVAIVAGPFAGLAAAVWLAWGHGVGLTDIVLALVFYMITGLGVTVGYHRLVHRYASAADCACHRRLDEFRG